MLLSLNCLNLIFHGTFWQVLAEGESKYGYIALIRTRSPKFKNTCATSAGRSPDLTHVHPQPRAIFTQIWAGVWAKKFDGQLR